VVPALIFDLGSRMRAHALGESTASLDCPSLTDRIDSIRETDLGH
jgi:hypothetical protein